MRVCESGHGCPDFVADLQVIPNRSFPGWTTPNYLFILLIRDTGGEPAMKISNINLIPGSVVLFLICVFNPMWMNSSR